MALIWGLALVRGNKVTSNKNNFCIHFVISLASSGLCLCTCFIKNFGRKFEKSMYLFGAVHETNLIWFLIYILYIQYIERSQLSANTFPSWNISPLEVFRIQELAQLSKSGKFKVLFEKLVQNNMIPKNAFLFI